MKKDKCILLADPSIRYFGYAVYNIKKNEVPVLGTVSTKGGKHDGLHIADVDIDSLTTIVNVLREDCFDKYNIVGVVVEHSAGGSLNHRASRTLALSEAIIIGIASFKCLPMLLPTQSEVKHALLGKRTADKQEIEDVVLAHFPGIELNLPKKKSERSHPVDALSLLLVARDWKRYWEWKDEH